MSELHMPFLGEDMQTGTLLEWRIQPGDSIRRGDIVALVDTEKAEIEIESFESGVVEKLVLSPGEAVPVGAVIALLRAAEGGAAVSVPPASAPQATGAAETDAVPAPRARAAEPAAQAVSPGPAIAAIASVAPAAGAAPVTPPPPLAPAAPLDSDRVRATPLARRRAAELGVDLGSVTGSGPGGAVTQADLAGASARAGAPQPAAAAVSASAPERVDRSAGMRRAIAAAMQRSKREIPHYYLETEIELGAALAWLEARNRERPVALRVLPAAWLLHATARALQEHPELNGFWQQGAFRPGEAVHLGVAIFLRGGGLVAPALRNAERATLDELMAALRDLVNRARQGSLRSSELGSATATVTNLGDQGVEKVFGVIHPPQVALIGFGRIAERPVALGGLLGVRPVVSATLAADHRASDGQRGARFLARLRELASTPPEPSR